MLAIAGLFGAAGVALSAAAAHLAGVSGLASAGEMLLVAAATLVGLSIHVRDGGGWTVIIAGAMLGIGTALFAGEIALAGLAGWRPWPSAAPLGGVLMIAGWLALPVGAALEWVFGRRRG